MAQTVAITEGTGHVILTFSGGKIKYVPKTGFAVQYDPNSGETDKVILSWASGDNMDAYDYERLNYLNVTSPSLANDQALVDLLVGYAVVATSGGGGAGGGSIVYTTSAGDFTATPTTAAKTITLAGLPFTLSYENLLGGSIKKIAAAGGDPTSLYSGSESIAISGNVITLADADNFVAGDILEITLLGPDKAYDRLQDQEKSLVGNPEWSHYTNEEHALSSTNDAVANYYYTPEIFMEGFRDISVQLTATTSGTNTNFKIFATLNPNAATPTPAAAPSSDWEEVSVAFFGASPTPLNGASVIKTNNREMVHKYVISYDIDNATNATDIFIRKY